jgi:hypothetical protein
MGLNGSEDLQPQPALWTSLSVLSQKDFLGFFEVTG